MDTTSRSVPPRPGNVLWMAGEHVIKGNEKQHRLALRNPALSPLYVTATIQIVTPSTSLAPPVDAAFVALLEAVPDAMVCIAADGRVVLVNAEAERLFGYKREELIGQLAEILVPEGSRAAHPGFRTGFLEDPRHRPMGGDMPLAGRRYDASTFPAEISLSAIDTGAGIMVTAAIRDITGQLRLRDLERSSQSLDTFIYSVSHDLRAPLRALSGYSGALLEEYGESLGGEGREYAERIVAVSEQMGRLIDYLMQVSRISRAELQLQPFDIGEEAARIAAELQSGEPGRHARFAIARPVQAVADRRLIRTVLENLLGNAWKFTYGRDDALIEFGTAPGGDASACYYVRDNGAGFDPEYAGKLFQPFQRLHPARDFPGTGTGTGLAAVRQIVELHGGRTWAEGTVGAGATFYFTLNGKESA
jgi:PAS domain S-box-containing protein